MRAPSDPFKSVLTPRQGKGRPPDARDVKLLDRWASHPDAAAVWAQIKHAKPDLAIEQFVRKVLTAAALAQARADAYRAYERDRSWITKWCREEVSKLLSSGLMYSEIADGFKEIAIHLRALETRYVTLWADPKATYVSRQDRRNPRVSRAGKEFIRNIHRYLTREGGKPLHGAVATLTGIAFPGEVLDSKDVINALRPARKRARKKVRLRKRKA
jgi:hypothetical protein